MNQQFNAIHPPTPQNRSSSSSFETARKQDSPNWKRLIVCAIAILLCWTQLLPRLEKVGAARTYIERMQARGINPSAVYYTEHPASRDWERTIRERIRRNPDSFWSIRQ